MSELQPTRLPDGEIRLMSQDTQTPSLGRIVLFTPQLGGANANGAKEYVAIIGQVWNDPHVERPYVNLLTFPPFGAPEWQGSCQEAIEPGEPRTWRFPPRVAQTPIDFAPPTTDPAVLDAVAATVDLIHTTETGA